MTERLYYTDAYLSTFNAIVASCHAGPGTAWSVILDRSAFYPTSGGQPFDLGALGEARVVEVVDRDGGDVVHITDAPLEPGAAVSGAIDWPRRFDHMQQHTGQHVLSAAFDRLFGARTESFHLGAESCTIDLAREVSHREAAAAVDEANRVVWENRTVSVRFVTDADAASLPLRKESHRTGTLRVVDIDDFDLSACGGTHVSRTGAIGIIVVCGAEKVRGGSRVEFLCGNRARRRFDAWRDALGAVMHHLSVAPGELADAVERLQSENKAAHRAGRALQEQLAAFEARALAARGTWTGDRLVVVEAMDGWDAAGLKALATAAASQTGMAIALFSQSEPALVVVASHPGAGVNAGEVIRALTTTFGGKGGGKTDLAQGGGLQGATADLIAAANALLSA